MNVNTQDYLFASLFSISKLCFSKQCYYFFILFASCIFPLNLILLFQIFSGLFNLILAPPSLLNQA